MSNSKDDPPSDDDAAEARGRKAAQDFLARQLKYLLQRDWTRPHNLGPIPVTKLAALGRQPQTTKELEEANFSGYRINEWTGDVELWLLGRLAERARCIDVARNPGLLAEMHEKTFHTTGTIIAIEDPPIPKQDLH